MDDNEIIINFQVIAHDEVIIASNLCSDDNTLHLNGKYERLLSPQSLFLSEFSVSDFFAVRLLGCHHHHHHHHPQPVGDK